MKEELDEFFSKIMDRPTTALNESGLCDKNSPKEKKESISGADN